MVDVVLNFETESQTTNVVNKPQSLSLSTHEHLVLNIKVFRMTKFCKKVSVFDISNTIDPRGT